ncbi:hypothetical protein KR067_001497 [Drosophila pandora]|nr:hypothetical protein KR067_001497 [Drosophila pandora]
MFHSLAFITCALTALSLAQGEGSGSNSGSGSVSGSGAKASLPALVTPAAAPAPGPTPASDIALPMAGSSKQLSRCHQSCNQQDWFLSYSTCSVSLPVSLDWVLTPSVLDSLQCCQNLKSPFELRVLKAQRQVSLVLTDIGWDEAIANASRQCLITWEVSGGGLIGNLLTDTAWAELSLWPDTVYNIQVKCKHRFTGLTRRSIKLNVDTSQLVGTTTTTTSATTRKHPQKNRNHATDRVYIISALPPPSELGGVVFPVFGALTFFLVLLVMFLFLRPQRKRFPLDTDTDTTTLIGRTSSRTSLDSSTLHV